MSPSSTFAQFVALVGDAVSRWRQLRHGSVHEQSVGTAPHKPRRARFVAAWRDG